MSDKNIIIQECNSSAVPRKINAVIEMQKNKNLSNT